jgi:serine protease Do
MALEPADIYRAQSPSVVLIFAKLDENTRSGGSGFFISKGIVVTNHHVIKGRDGLPVSDISVFIKPPKVTGDFQEDLKDKHVAHVLKYDAGLDIAVLQVEEAPSVTTLSFADSDNVEVGQKVVAIGHPEQGGLWTLTSGAISTRIKNLSNIKGKDMFQSDASINHGNSGGPLLDSNGMLVGMNSSTARKSADGSAIVGINFALQSNTIVRWLNQNNVQVSSAAPAKAVQAEAAPKASEPTAPAVEKVEKAATPAVVAASKPAIVTSVKPYKWDDLDKTIAEMEDLMGEMRGKVKDRFGN